MGTGHANFHNVPTVKKITPIQKRSVSTSEAQKPYPPEFGSLHTIASAARRVGPDMPSGVLPRLRCSSRAAASLIETLVAMLLIAVFLTSQYAATSRVWAVLRASLESNAANRVVNGRAEQIRASTWDQITSAAYFQATILSVPADAAGELGTLSETIDVTAYPPPAVNPQALQITRDNDSAVATTVAAGDGTMISQSGVRINLTARWTAKGGKARTRQMTMIFTNGGISGRH